VAEGQLRSWPYNGGPNDTDPAGSGLGVGGVAEGQLRSWPLQEQRPSDRVFRRLNRRKHREFWTEREGRDEEWTHEDERIGHGDSCSSGGDGSNG